MYMYFKKENVKIYFFENFKRNKQDIIDSIFINIGLDRHVGFKASGSENVIPNKGFSALAIKISLWRKYLLNLIGLNFLIHRPIFFFGDKSIPAGSESLSCLNKDKYWNNFFLRDNEEVRSYNYPNLSIFEKIRREFTWRYFIKNRFDRLMYIDWDVLDCNLRREMDQYFKDQNKNLEKLVKVQGCRIPEKYLK